ncbi:MULTISPECIES: type VI secretion system Vgr family protein [Bacteroides]|uniref:type VI secretion system Vgr family protein n=1 Tax=Bacteroides TaxID=816 RepID=UPI0008DA9AD7|nr:MULTISPECIES: phage baseplate assembly protein V [Bacteroides]
MLEEKKISISIDGNPLHSFLQVMLKQVINDHHYFEISLDIEVGETYATHSLEQAKNWLGKKVVIQMGENTFVGIATHVSLHRADGNHGCLLLTGYSNTFLLESDQTCASWLDKTLANIVSEICEKAGVTAQVSPEYTEKIEYECQYRESNFDFIRRLARQYHEWLYYDGKQLIFGKPAVPAGIPLMYGRNLQSLDISIQTIARPLAGQSYHSPDGQKYESTSPDAPKGLGNLGHAAFQASIGLFKSPANQSAEPRISNKGELDSYFQKKQQSDTAASHYITSESDCYSLTVGSVVDIQTAIQIENFSFAEQTLGSYIITEITHIIGSGNSYYNTFTALSATVPSLPAPEVPLPVAQTQQAVVVSNDDPKKQGRVQVKMNWQSGDMKTSWIRVMTPDAGMSDKVSTNRGFVFIPEKDDIVLVGFRHDDPNRPFVMGSLFNGNTGAGGDSGNKKKSLTTRSGCTITIDDDAGSILITDPSGSKVLLGGDKTITIDSEEKITLHSKVIEIHADEKIDANGKTEASMTSDKIKIDGTTETAIKSSTVIKENAPTIEAEGKQSVAIKGTMIDVDGKTMTNVKGGILNLNM